MYQGIQGFQEFMDQSRSNFHAVANVSAMLEKAGYQQLKEADSWSLSRGGKYYFVRGGSAVMAFRIPEGEAQGFLFSAAHCDFPTFKLKENGELTGKYTRLATEKYGGMLMHAWLDRPLSVAGRVLVDTPEGVESRLVNIDQDLLLIPNVAIHMNRKANEGVAWNPAVDTLPLVGGEDAKGKLQALLEEQAGGKILGHDLYLYLRQKACVWGVDAEYVSAQGLDDLGCVWGCTQGFLAGSCSDAIHMLCVFDNEECGNLSCQGADSRLLDLAVQRICQALDLDQARLLSRSFMVSADNAHAIHPNHPEYSDATNAPVINGGVVIKFNANLKYATTGYSAAVFRKVCQGADVPVQTYYNRADLPGGGTLGSISISQVSVPTVDIGLPQLAMHSCYETMGVKDAEYLCRAMAAFYSMEAPN